MLSYSFHNLSMRTATGVQEPESPSSRSESNLVVSKQAMESAHKEAVTDASDSQPPSELTGRFIHILASAPPPQNIQNFDVDRKQRERYFLSDCLPGTIDRPDSSFRAGRGCLRDHVSRPCAIRGSPVRGSPEHASAAPVLRRHKKNVPSSILGPVGWPQGS